MHAIARQPALIEPVPVQECFARGVVIERDGGVVRAIVYDERRNVFTGAVERIVVGRFSLLQEDFAAAVEVALREIGGAKLAVLR